MNDDADVSMESLGGKGDSRDGGIVWTSTQTGTETINDILKYSSSKFCFGCSADENTRERVESCRCRTVGPGSFGEPRNRSVVLFQTMFANLFIAFRLLLICF